MLGPILLAALLAGITATAYSAFPWTRWGRSSMTLAVGLLSIGPFLVLSCWVVDDGLPTRGETATLYLPAAFPLIGLGQGIDRLLGRRRPRLAPAFETRSAELSQGAGAVREPVCRTAR
ncbi:hypothetical protein AB0H43_30380 [Hamadaea sp. NPDC050747]|uniref:hypothetical protein n=1 Tax=Hamadaea sp. NPDC050747 TaxID=3155789 RepID=UPI0033F1C4FB